MPTPVTVGTTSTVSAVSIVNYNAVSIVSGIDINLVYSVGWVNIVAVFHSDLPAPDSLSHLSVSCSLQALVLLQLGQPSNFLQVSPILFFLLVMLGIGLHD